jgi:ribosomal protein S21
MINVQIERNPNENTATVLRKFTKGVQEAGILNRIRGRRYHSRQESAYVRKKKTLKVLARRKELEKMHRLGKAIPR